MWGQQAVTNKRNILDQSTTVTVTNNTVNLNFNSLKNVGYLRGIRLYAPYQAGVVAIGTGTNTIGAALQMPQLRQINHCRIQLQGIAPLYDVDGPDLGYLAYVSNGVRNLPGYPSVARLGYTSATAPAANEFPFSFPTNQTGAASLIAPGNQFLPVVESGASVFNSGYFMYIPFSEWISFPNTPMGSGGNAVILSDAQMEMGLIFMQNNQQVMTPYITIAALYGATADNRVVTIVTGNATVTQTNQSWNIEDEFYDVPPNPADRPNGYQMAFVVTRTAVDRTASNGIAVHSFKQAGILLRAIYVLYNDNAGTGFGTVIDPALTPAASLTLKSGATIIKKLETAGLNQLRCVEQYGFPPPGILVHDLMPDGTITDCIDTATLIDVRTEFSGLATTVNRVHVIEERLIPITTPA